MSDIDDSLMVDIHLFSIYIPFNSIYNLKELEIIDIQKQRADIDYIALMSGIDLEV